jgi:hypothetical protein
MRVSTCNGNAGVAVPFLQSLFAHASPETTMIYTHPLGVCVKTSDFTPMRTEIQ